MFETLAHQAFSPRDWMRAALGFVRLSADAFGDASPEGEGRAVWREFQNKLQVFELFEHADAVLGLCPVSRASLAEGLRRARALGPYTSVWLTEGLGHDYAEACWSRTGGCPRGVLAPRGDDVSLPGWSLAALHAGMGLSFAQRLSRALTPRSHPREVRRVLSEFFDLCDANARAGYVGAAYESLGLVARTIFPHIVGVVDRGLCEMDEEVLAYFWHGVGRALYFAPANFMPSADAARRAAEMARSEPPHELGRLNARAGLAWALALVNIRHPEVLESALKNQCARLSSTDAFANGVCSGVLVWYDSTRDPGLIIECCGRVPREPDLARLWESQVVVPCRRAVRDLYPLLKESGRLGEVFRYQSPQELAESLRR